MGMYTQIRGWLNIGSVGKPEALVQAQSRLKRAQAAFSERTDVDRHWVCHDTWAQMGSNGATWLFIGSEHKNYDNSFDEWLTALLQTFTEAEGRVDYQYEEECFTLNDNPPSIHGFVFSSPGRGSTSRFVIVRDGQIIEDGREPTRYRGYGGK